MQVDKSVIKNILNNVFYWTLINITFNIFGLWFSKLILKEGFIYPESIKTEFIVPMLIQSVIFAVCFSLITIFLKKNKLSWLYFTAFQFVLMHIAFFMGIKFAGGLHYETTINNFGLRYLGYQGQYFIDFIFSKMQLNGMFENGLFIPQNTIAFYTSWVFSVILYYLFISWLSKVSFDFFRIKTDIKQSEKTDNQPINDI